MKNVSLLFLILLISFKSLGQGADVVFLIDNSGSIDLNEYNQMTASINTIMENVLECNSGNKVTVVQYSATGSTPRIYIHSVFTNSMVNFTRQYDNNGLLYPSIGLLSDALNGIVNPSTNVTSTIKTLNQTVGNTLVVYVFTDAARNNDLVNGSIIGSSAAFQEFTDFKNSHNATFIVTVVPPDTNAEAAAAAIASVGGNYTGSVESYPADPDGPGTLPRFLLNPENGFFLSPSEIDIVIEDICSSACASDLVLVSPTDNVLSGTIDNRQASNSISASNIINSGATSRYHAENVVYLKPGFNAKTGSYFRAYIEGCSGIFAGRIPEEGTQAMMLETEGNIIKSLSLSPNPANEKVKVQYDDIINSLTVTSIEGITMFNQSIDRNSFDLYIANYKPGVYIVTIQTEDGKILTEKLIKN